MCVVFFFFLKNLTDEECSEDKMNNLQFYLNKFPSAPDGNQFSLFITRYFKCLGLSVCNDLMLFLSFGTEVFIESFLRDWKNDYKRLERVHSYIQWYVLLGACGVCFG